MARAFTASLRTTSVSVFLANIFCGFYQLQPSQAAAVNVNIDNRRPFGFGTSRNIHVASGGVYPPNARGKTPRAGGLLNYVLPALSRRGSGLEYVPAYVPAYVPDYVPDYGNGYGGGSGYGFANGFGYGGRRGHTNFQYANVAPFPNAQKVDYSHRSIAGFVNLDDP
ncbi:hypothetical protein HPB47_026951 [Ixodes persulcatus]|uniref:Uncharacterized protein n=1 Tax=Ixodes persulcatus TaxID=34615 RepID=A0AC60PXL1_IXOPE|nr:hypothetical protein HPB47_026951 [Ixodes persulcatus]